MITSLQRVSIPGYPEAVLKERNLRDKAWIDGPILLCGVPCVQLSLRRLLWLEQARCGLVVPCTFDDEADQTAHVILFLRILQSDFGLPKTFTFSIWRTFWDNLKAHRFAMRVRKHNTPEAMVEEVTSYISECFLDAPKGSSSSSGQSYASYPAYIMDHIAAAGHKLSTDEMLDMPLVRLWQLYRVASERLYDIKLTNPSDDLATQWLAKQYGNRS